MAPSAEATILDIWNKSHAKDFQADKAEFIRQGGGCVFPHRGWYLHHPGGWAFLGTSLVSALRQMQPLRGWRLA